MKRKLLSIAVVLSLLVAGSVNAQFKRGSAFVKSKSQLTATTPDQAHTPKNGRIMITHSIAQDIVQGTVACSDQTTGYTSENHFLREFDLVGDFQISGAFYVTNIEFGVENAASGGGTGQPVMIDLYTTTGSLNFSSLTLIASLDTILPDMSLGIWSVPLNATVPHGTTLVVDINNLDGQPFSHTFFAGSNNLGETADSYIAADSCGIANPTTFTAIGFSDVNLVINVYGDVATGINEQDVQMHTWPNPVMDMFNVELPEGQWNLRITDLNGKMVYDGLSTGKTAINLSNLSNGLYLFQAEQGEKVYRQKLMVR